jgi:hypothetical protein
MSNVGEAYQFGWSHEHVLLAGTAVTLKVAQTRPCYSRMPFVRAYPDGTRRSAELLAEGSCKQITRERAVKSGARHSPNLRSIMRNNTSRDRSASSTNPLPMHGQTIHWVRAVFARSSAGR